jgi:hypothetical protein
MPQTRTNKNKLEREQLLAKQTKTIVRLLSDFVITDILKLIEVSEHNQHVGQSDHV